MVSLIQINMESCIGCEACVELCPTDVFRFETSTKKPFVKYPKIVRLASFVYGLVRLKPSHFQRGH